MEESNNLPQRTQAQGGYFLKQPSHFLAVIILSSPSESKRRKLIRETWLTDENRNDIQHFFPIGLKALNKTALHFLQKEQGEFGDLLFLEDLEDSYQNLP